MGAETGEGEASGAGFESGAETGCILDEGVGLLGDEVWAGWEYMGVEASVGRLGFSVWAGWELMESEGSMGRLGDEASELFVDVLGRVCGEGSMHGPAREMDCTKARV